jgi:hypothetical protein
LMPATARQFAVYPTIPKQNIAMGGIPSGELSWLTMLVQELWGAVSVS